MDTYKYTYFLYTILQVRTKCCGCATLNFAKADMQPVILAESDIMTLYNLTRMYP